MESVGLPAVLNIQMVGLNGMVVVPDADRNEWLLCIQRPLPRDPCPGPDRRADIGVVIPAGDQHIVRFRQLSAVFRELGSGHYIVKRQIIFDPAGQPRVEQRRAGHVQPVPEFFGVFAYICDL